MPSKDSLLGAVGDSVSASADKFPPRLKKNAISVAAVSGPSEPCTTFSSIEAAKSARIVPGAACFGFVAPMMSRFALMAFSPSSTCTMTGPEIM